MKEKKKHTRKTGAKSMAAVIETPRAAYWPYALGFFLALAAAFQVYGPSLYGPFIFDDQYLPFSVPNFPADSWRAWVSGNRPVLMLSYWVNFELSGLQTF